MVNKYPNNSAVVDYCVVHVNWCVLSICMTPIVIRPLLFPLHLFHSLHSQRRHFIHTMTFADGKHRNVHAFDQAKITADVRKLAESDAPIAGLVREALDVIDQALDDHSCVLYYLD